MESVITEDMIELSLNLSIINKGGNWRMTNEEKSNYYKIFACNT